MSFLGARIAFVDLLNEIYRKEGRLITVNATGDRQETLELVSGLIAAGTHTLEAAKRGTVDSQYAMTAIKRARFKSVVIRGERYRESYVIAP